MDLPQDTHDDNTADPPGAPNSAQPPTADQPSHSNSAEPQTPEQARIDIKKLKVSQATAKRQISNMIKKATRLAKEFSSFTVESPLQIRAANALINEISSIEAEISELNISTASHAKILVANMVDIPLLEPRCKSKIEELEEAEEKYNETFLSFRQTFADTINMAYTLAENASQAALASSENNSVATLSSRPTSPSFGFPTHAAPQPQFLNCEQWKPATLSQDCTYSEGIRFQEDFTQWGKQVYAAFPTISNESWFSMLKTTVDAFWWQRLRDQNYGKEKSIDFALQLITRQLQISYPLLRRRSDFFVQRPAKGETPREFLYSLLRNAEQAEISKLNSLNTCMLIFANQVNDPKARDVCLRHLHDKPEGVLAILESELSKMEALEANKPGKDLQSKRVNNRNPPPNSPCPLCDQVGHWRRDCQVPCSHCGRKGSHRSDDCRSRGKGGRGSGNWRGGRGGGNNGQGRGGNNGGGRSRSGTGGRGRSSQPHAAKLADHQDPPPASSGNEGAQHQQQAPPPVAPSHASHRVQAELPPKIDPTLFDSLDDSFEDSWTTVTHHPVNMQAKRIFLSQRVTPPPENDSDEPGVANDDDLPDLVTSSDSCTSSESSDSESSDPEDECYNRTFSDISFDASYENFHYEILAAVGVTSDNESDADNQDQLSSFRDAIASSPQLSSPTSPPAHPRTTRNRPMHCGACCCYIWAHPASDCPRNPQASAGCQGHHGHASLIQPIQYPDFSPTIPPSTSSPSPPSPAPTPDTKTPDPAAPPPEESSDPAAPCPEESSDPAADIRPEESPLSNDEPGPEASSRSPPPSASFELISPDGSPTVIDVDAENTHTKFIRRNFLSKLSDDNIRASVAQLSRRRPSSALDSKGRNRPDVQ